MRLTLPLLIAALAAPQSAPPGTGVSEDVMLAAVSRDESLLRGGIGPSKWTGKGTVAVEPLVLVTKDGEWKSIPCVPDKPTLCRKFAREYLSKPHNYTVISSDGKGAVIRAAPATLSECSDFAGTGTYTGAAIAKSAIAASEPDWFAESSPVLPADAQEAAKIRRALGAFIPKRLDSTKFLRFFHTRLEGRDMIVLRRSFSDVEGYTYRRVFAIGAWNRDRLQILWWTKDLDDYQDEVVLGTVALKSGRAFLITVVHHDEGRYYRIYAIRDGRLARVYEGGGSSC